MFDIKKAGAYTLDLIFPNRCPLCGEVINWKYEYCQGCFDELPYTGEEFCHGCGNISSSCICHRNENLFSRCYAAFYYLDSAKGGVVYLKNTKNNVFPRLFAEKIRSDIEADPYEFKADFIVPVPMSKTKLRKRGFNQAEVLADALSQQLNIPICNNALVKSISFVAQHKLSATRRKSNASHLYSAGKNIDIKGKTVIIVDEVMTTGSTINSCAEILLRMGAEKIIAAVAASTI
ncbi:MAG: double zinc ribbon domain-containing protein [Oscillospiraceae bacterium]|nr:double zinc ribbon domain-containing protein [Oscillospiraceae bacterium]